MKPPTPLMIVAGCVLCLTSCQTPQKLAKNQAEAQAWLDGQTASARINVSGSWFAESWGKAAFKQSGRNITGTLDTYQVKGVVSGSKAYLTAWDSGKCYYTIMLSQTAKNVLTGSYSDGPKWNTDAKKQRSIELRRSY